MQIKANDIIPQRQLHVFAPHYDDTLFMLGNWLFAARDQGWLEQVEVHVHQIFSRSNYLAHHGALNLVTTKERLQQASGTRLIEDLDCLDELIGQAAYHYTLWGERECFVRQKAMSAQGMEFPHGMREDFDDNDRAIYGRLLKRLAPYMARPEAALIFPLAIREHIDHYLLREAAAELAPTAKAAVYFVEDKPYAGHADAAEWGRIEAFVQGLQEILIPAQAHRMADMAFFHYQSQVDETYRQGLLDRAEQLEGRDRLFLWQK